MTSIQHRLSRLAMRVVALGLLAQPAAVAQEAAAKGYLEEAQQATSDGRYLDALAAYAGAAVATPDDPRIYEQRANLFMSLSHPDLASGDYRRAVRLNPDDAVSQALLRSAGTVSITGRRELAESAARNGSEAMRQMARLIPEMLAEARSTGFELSDGQEQRLLAIAADAETYIAGHVPLLLGVRGAALAHAKGYEDGKAFIRAAIDQISASGSTTLGELVATLTRRLPEIGVSGVPPEDLYVLRTESETGKTKALPIKKAAR